MRALGGVAVYLNRGANMRHMSTKLQCAYSCSLRDKVVHTNRKCSICCLLNRCYSWLIMKTLHSALEAIKPGRADAAAARDAWDAALLLTSQTKAKAQAAHAAQDAARLGRFVAASAKFSLTGRGGRDVGERTGLPTLAWNTNLSFICGKNWAKIYVRAFLTLHLTQRGRGGEGGRVYP